MLKNVRASVDKMGLGVKVGLDLAEKEMQIASLKKDNKKLRRI